jgi:hypothetical protein
MSDTQAMVRLMENAAEHLRLRLGEMTNGTGNPTEMRTVAAMAYARATLQMVAASVAPEGNAQITRLIDSLSGEDYGAWADERTETAMTEGELAAVARFLRWQHLST